MREDQRVYHFNVTARLASSEHIDCQRQGEECMEIRLHRICGRNSSRPLELEHVIEVYAGTDSCCYP